MIKDGDCGPEPYVLNIEQETILNENYRTVRWTGENLQMTYMSIPVGEDVGIEIHPDNDQFLRIDQGEAEVIMSPADSKEDAKEWNAKEGYAIFVPKNTWHNIVNTGGVPLKLYSIYAPPKHDHGVVQPTRYDKE